MHHPRRHEVFRDVGSALRDKDEPDYVEVIDDTLEDDAAILVCSDGLTDMIPSAVKGPEAVAQPGPEHPLPARARIGLADAITIEFEALGAP